MLPVAKIDLQFMAFWDVSLYTLVKNMTFGGKKILIYCFVTTHFCQQMKMPSVEAVHMSTSFFFVLFLFILLFLAHTIPCLHQAASAASVHC